MKTLITAASLALSALASQASVLTFDSLNSNDLPTSVTEGDYEFSMVSGLGGTEPHLLDGGNLPGTLNWHDGGSNGEGSFVSMVRTDGGLFEVRGFDFGTSGTLGTSCGVMSTSTGTAGLSGCVVNELRFWVNGSANATVWLDNINVTPTSPVPEPGSLAMATLGLLGLGAWRRLQR